MAETALAKQVYRRRGKQGYYLDCRGNRHQYDSILERRRMQTLDLAGLRFRREPVKIKYVWGGRVRVYVTDLAVYDRSGVRLLRIEEVKPRVLIDDPQNKAKWAAATIWAANRGCDFRVVTEQTIGEA